MIQDVSMWLKKQMLALLYGTIAILGLFSLKALLSDAHRSDQIPRTFHWIYLENRPLSELERFAIQSWIDLIPKNESMQKLRFV